MPTYNSLGISASLMVTDLDQTVSDKILLRMGAAQQRDTKRIQSQLYNGRALLEQHVSSQNCRGVLQFVGEDEDMALFIVEASHKQDDIDNAVRDIGIGKGQCSAKTNTAPTPTKETTQSYLQGVQGVTSCENNKSAANSQGIGNDSSGHHDRSKETKTIGQIAIPMEKSSNTQKQPKSLDSDTTDTLALCLKVDLTKYWQTVSKTSPLLHGADLKAEILINGHLVEAAYLNNRNNSRSELIHFTGTRFHRQAEKPWVYKPSSSQDINNTSELRWTTISRDLIQEASVRGINKWKQPPISAQFLAALSQMQLPEAVVMKNQQFAILDLVITSGKGRKSGPDTAYIAGPTRLSDVDFCGLAPFADDLGLPTDQGGDLESEDALSETLGRLRPQTSEPTHMQRAREYQDAMQATPMKIILSKYENTPGKVKGKRTLRQRIGDMTKMSPRKRQQALSGMQEDLDDTAISAIMNIFGIKTAETPALEALVTARSAPVLSTSPTQLRDLLHDKEPVTPSTVRVSSLLLNEEPILDTSPPRTPPRSVPQQFTPRSTRTAKKWYPDEQTSDEALENFTIPDFCVETPVTYADGLTQRQVPKTRDGEFEEQQFIVGMRFIVL